MYLERDIKASYLSGTPVFSPGFFEGVVGAGQALGQGGGRNVRDLGAVAHGRGPLHRNQHNFSITNL